MNFDKMIMVANAVIGWNLARQTLHGKTLAPSAPSMNHAKRKAQMVRRLNRRLGK